MKPITRNRIETHNEKDLEVWFEKYRYTLAKYKIKSSKKIHNMDELGACIGCPRGEKVMVPSFVKELSHYDSPVRNVVSEARPAE